MKSTIDYIAKSLNVNSDNIIPEYLSFSVEGSGKTILSCSLCVKVISNNLTSYASCAFTSPSSVHYSENSFFTGVLPNNFINIEEIISINKICNQPLNCNNLFLPISFFNRNNISFNNCFNSYKFYIKNDGVCGNFNYKKDTIISVNPFLNAPFWNKINPEDILYVKISL